MPKPPAKFAQPFESAVAEPRFSMKMLVDGARRVLGAGGVLTEVDAALELLAPKARDYVFASLLRHVFLIELVNRDITSTKMEIRWADRLPRDDPRHQNFAGCWAIFEGLLSVLKDATGKAQNRSLLEDIREHRLIAYELPLDYKRRILDAPVHTPENLAWQWGDGLRTLVELRKTLRSTAENPYADIFTRILDQKVQVKTYLTDRVQTGDHQTDREKRWECHPQSVHFALRRVCWDVEAKLMARVCHFAGFPKEVFGRLQAKGVVEPGEVARCPVTLSPLQFKEFEREVRDPEHGEAAFQVGHLNPLKAGVGDPKYSHTADNIDWVSADGNRIQGKQTLDESVLSASVRDGRGGAGVAS